MGAEKLRVTGGEKKPGKQSLISANSSMPGLGKTHTKREHAKTGMLNPPGICWHHGTPYALVWHALTNAHTFGSVTVAIECGGRERKKGGGGRGTTLSAHAPHYKCIHIWAAG